MAVILSHVQPPAAVRAQSTRVRNPGGRRGWVIHIHSLVPWFSLSLLIEFELVVFCFLKKWERMKLHKHNDVNSPKNLLPFSLCYWRNKREIICPPTLSCF